MIASIAVGLFSVMIPIVVKALVKKGIEKIVGNSTDQANAIRQNTETYKAFSANVKELTAKVASLEAKVTSRDNKK